MNLRKKLKSIKVVLVLVGLVLGMGMGININASAGFEATLDSLNSQNFPFIFLNVRVTDNGTAVTDLTADNFQCSEDGVLQTDSFQVTPPQTSGGVRLADVIFLIDTSGSMGGAINEVKNNVNIFADSLASSDVDYRLGLVQFGQSSNSGHPQLFNGGNLTDNADQFKEFVSTLNATGGYEPGFLALRMAAQEFNFRPGAQKVFLLISDEDSDDKDKEGTIALMQTNDIVAHTAVDCGSGNSNSDYCDDTSVRAATGGQLFGVQGPYSDILSSIVEQTASTYIIRYKSNNPSFDGIERAVECAITHGIDQAVISGSYIPGSAPSIALSPQTKVLNQNTLPENSPDAIIRVSVTDEVAPFVQSNGVRLYYRTSGSNSDYSSMVMNLNGQYYEATIPTVKNPGVDYYIIATDGEQTSSLPSTDPSVYSFQIAVLPNVAPDIDHEPVVSTSKNQPVTIIATITDTTNFLAEAILRYRHLGELIYKTIEMQNTSGDMFEAVVAADDVTEDIEYYLIAKDDLSVAAFEATADNPFVIEVGGQSQCSDGIDNDGDGLIDADDPSCISSDGDDESKVWPSLYQGKYVQTLIDGNGITLQSDRLEGILELEDVLGAMGGNEEKIKEFQDWTCNDDVISSALAYKILCDNKNSGYGTLGPKTRDALKYYFDDISAVDFFTASSVLRIAVDEYNRSMIKENDIEWWFVKDPAAKKVRGWVNGKYLHFNFNEDKQKEWKENSIKFISPIANTYHNTVFISSIMDHSGDYNCWHQSSGLFDGNDGKERIEEIIDNTRVYACPDDNKEYTFECPEEEETKEVLWCNNAIKIVNCSEYPKKISCDKKVTNFYGETAILDNGVNSYPYGYHNEEGFLKESTEIYYTGDSSGNQYLNYDGHSGYDFPGRGMTVVAVADGILCKADGAIIPQKCPYGKDLVNAKNSNGWKSLHSFYIVHDNGYSTWYLHTDPIDQDVIERDIASQGYSIVSQGQKIATSSGWGFQEDGIYGPNAYRPHLHFEVRKDGNQTVNLKDPYDDESFLWEKSIFSQQTLLKVVKNPSGFIGRGGNESSARDDILLQERDNQDMLGNFQVYDFDGNRAGLFGGVVINEIPFANYEDGTILLNETDIASIIVEGIDSQSYSLQLTQVGNDSRININSENIPIIPNEVHKYTLDWDKIEQNEEGVTVKIDKDGDGEFEHSIETGSEFSDLVAPETQITTSGTEGNNSWFKSDTEITLSAEDNEGGVGVQKTEYSLDDGNTWNEYADKFTISDEGIHTIQYRSMDWFNNLEEAKTQEIKIDKTVPEANISFDEQGKNLAITGIDNLSDVAVARDGEKNYILTDEAGNTLTLCFKKIIKRKKIIGMFLKGMQYSDDEEINVPRTTLFYGWNTKKDGALRHLFQKVKVKGKYIGKALYHYRLDKTFTITKLKGEKPMRETFNGLKKINLTTNLGELDFSFK